MKKLYTRFVIPMAIMFALAFAEIIWISSVRIPEPIPPKPLICIDPGHPTSFNSGKRIVNGATELDINWAVAEKLEKVLKDKYDFHVIKTRKQKHLVMENSQRAEVANEFGAALMISLHCDAGPNHGFTIYYPDAEATFENIKGPSKEIITGSRYAAYMIHSGMSPQLKGHLKDRGVRTERSTKVGRLQGALTASIVSEVPVVTVEMVFLTDEYDAEFIKNESGRQLMANALAEGIHTYIRWLEKNQSRKPLI